MQMPKPTEADKQQFRSVVPDAPGVEVRPMFGNLGAFVNGTMFAGWVDKARTYVATLPPKPGKK